ncbi:ArnT family glycosyltransferase [Fluviicola taffensis]|uniref:Alg9 family protein mannosyltransferase n=1 Tax=Fluviicola taffensis (strain DSM 16823 / NCIMB 13979 / RW262) TaxID=755732 RepID=F2IAR3_FLUTR|nr:glycosyltransferase family 39 protein [Fluviicola taffensis]AEA44218.1 Alg9 family protein mannosyltransferase [Fluviicola taffensis DSM 16823]
MQLSERIKTIDWSSLKTILFVGLIVRLIAAIFSEGYAMHDDHFLVIEAAGSWADGFDYNHWLPWNKPAGSTPEGHSFTYVGLNYLFFSGLKSLGISDPKVLMLINRFVHALFSLLIIRFGYLITEKLSSKKTATYVGWLLALLWAMPFLSVRNLVEVVSIPFLMWAVWLTLKENSKWALFYAGLLIGVAISFRYQIAIYAVGLGIYYVFKLEWRKLILMSAGSILLFVLTQGVVDYFIWGYPFAEFRGYVVYNMNEGTQYMGVNRHNYFMYFYVLFGLLLFPLGIMALVAYFKSAKKYAILFVPTVIFLLFHSWFPNRQERFILTIFPLVVILVFLGIEQLRERPFWNKFWKISWVSFWILNTPLLCVLTVMPSKQSRINTMYSLNGRVKGNERILIEATGETNPEMMPFFYSGKWNYTVTERWSLDTINPASFYTAEPKDYIFFFGQKNLEQRIDTFQVIYPKMHREAQINPSFVDKFLHGINPRNSNSYVEIWKTEVKD